MTGAEDIVFAFLPAQEATQAAELSDRRQTSAPAAEQFMRIGLVPSVPNDAVLGRFENIVERQSELHSAKRGSEDRKSTRLNSSHSQISYAVFCLKKKKKK